MLINRTDLENFVSIIFGNWCRQLNFAVVFGVKDCKYRNIISTPIIFNSRHWDSKFFMDW